MRFLNIRVLCIPCVLALLSLATSDSIAQGGGGGGACGGAGDCCEANGTPGCNDLDCCADVCDTDPFCCDTEWDQTCADTANDLCESCGNFVFIEGWNDNWLTTLFDEWSEAYYMTDHPNGVDAAFSSWNGNFDGMLMNAWVTEYEYSYSGPDMDKSDMSYERGEFWMQISSTNGLYFNGLGDMGFSISNGINTYSGQTEFLRDFFVPAGTWTITFNDGGYGESSTFKKEWEDKRGNWYYEYQYDYDASGSMWVGTDPMNPEFCIGDLDLNGFVDGADLAILLGAFNQLGFNKADLNLDFIVDGEDLAMLLGGWGECS
ncbi:MAG: hypothetical protein CMJ32_04555 [Phycisphaerae bacterium]|nr:hypothetical protein [Phycisphaerae bacterium]